MRLISYFGSQISKRSIFDCKKKEHLHLLFVALCVIVLLLIFSPWGSWVFLASLWKLFDLKVLEQWCIFHIAFVWNTPIARKSLNGWTANSITSISDYMISIFDSCYSYIVVQLGISIPIISIFHWIFCWIKIYDIRCFFSNVLDYIMIFSLLW